MFELNWKTFLIKIMTINDAYVKGLDAAENAVFQNFTELLNGNDSLKFQNPKMEELRQQLIQILVGTSKNVEQSEFEYDDIRVKVPEWSTQDITDMFEAIISDRPYILSTALPCRVTTVLQTFESLMNHFKALAKKKNNVGKAFANILKEKQDLLTNKEIVIN